jgi:hypothetical protein
MLCLHDFDIKIGDSTLRSWLDDFLCSTYFVNFSSDHDLYNFNLLKINHNNNNDKGYIYKTSHKLMKRMN